MVENAHFLALETQSAQNVLMNLSHYLAEPRKYVASVVVVGIHAQTKK